MKIYTLMENSALDGNFACEHGLSLYIESNHHTILFDFGQTSAFAGNAEKLGADLSKVDIAVLSHGHYDHSGGIKEFFRLNKTAKILINKNVSGDFYSSPWRYIGIDKTVLDSDRIVFTDDYYKIDDEIYVCTCNEKPRRYSSDAVSLLVRKENEFLPDEFLHEQYLIINDGGKKIVFSGCSHKGILNVAEWLKPDILIGGFHFKNYDALDRDRELIKKSAEILASSGAEFYTCHCTGEKQYQLMKSVMGEKLNYLSAGSVISIL